MRSGPAQQLDQSCLVPSEQEGPRWYGTAAVALAAVLFVGRLGVRALWASEGRWAEVVREMQLSSNYFWPTINGHLYYDKPLLSYWFIVIAAHLTGGLNEAAARLPSAFFGLIGVVVTIALARRLYDRTTAAMAGFILATSFSYAFYSRHASADIETTTGVLAALTLFVWHRQRPSRWWVVWLWILMAATSLTKGLIGLALPLWVMGLYSLLEPGAAELRRRVGSGDVRARLEWLLKRLEWFFNLKTPIAIAAAAALYFLPFVLSQSRTHSDAGLYMVFRENVVRFFEPFDHRGPIYLYVYVIFVLMAPWCVFLPAALVEMHRRVRSAAQRALADADLFALVYFWGTFTFFTLSRSRRSYYLLPILPAAALVVARLLAARAADLCTAARRLTIAGYTAAAALVIVSGIGYLMPPAMRPGSLRMLPPSPERMIFLLGWLVCVATIVNAARGFTIRRAALSTALIAYLGLFFMFIVAMPRTEAYRYERSFARAVRANLGDRTDQLAFFRIWGPGLVYYLAMPAPVPLFNLTDQVADFAHDKGGAWLITRARDVQNLKMASELRAEEPELPWDSPAENGSRYVLVRVR